LAFLGRFCGALGFGGATGSAGASATVKRYDQTGGRFGCRLARKISNLMLKYIVCILTGTLYDYVIDIIFFRPELDDKHQPGQYA
jgi:hypothetical protein